MLYLNLSIAQVHRNVWILAQYFAVINAGVTEP